MLRETLIPPPLDILTKKYAVNEPLRTGFNQGLIPVGIKHNVENQRFTQGPLIQVKQLKNNPSKATLMSSTRELNSEIIPKASEDGE
jgi:hypothetical protein